MRVSPLSLIIGAAAGAVAVLATAIVAATKPDPYQVKSWREIEAALLGSLDDDLRQTYARPSSGFKKDAGFGLGSYAKIDFGNDYPCNDPMCVCSQPEPTPEVCECGNCDCNDEPWISDIPECDSEEESMPAGILCFSAEVVGEPESLTTEDFALMESKLIASGYDCVDNLTADELAEAYAELCLHEYFEACSSLMDDFSRDLIKFSWRIVDNP